MKRALVFALLLLLLSACSSDAAVQPFRLLPQRELGEGIYRTAGLESLRDLAWSPKDEALLVGLSGRYPYPPADECVPLPVACWIGDRLAPEFNSEISVVDVRTEERRQILKTEVGGKIILAAFWLPDGQHIGYIVPPYGNSAQDVGTWSVSVDGRDDRKTSSKIERAAFLSPDGNYTATVEGFSVVVRRTGSAGQTLLYPAANLEGSIKTVSWAADSSRLSFATSEFEADRWTTRPHVHTINIATGIDSEFSGEPYDVFSDPQLSPTGKFIAFVHERPSFYIDRIELRELSTGCQAQIPIDNTLGVSWSSDGSSLLILVHESSRTYIVKLSEYLGPKFAATGSICP